MDNASFLLAVAISSLFEILLTMYMGVLTQRGFAPPASAFALSGSAIRAGICLGNGTALIYERVPGWHEVLVRPTFVALIALLAGMLITMVRQEYAIDELTGFVTALLAQHWPPLEALLAAVHLHGGAADTLVAQGHGPIGLTAGELIDSARACFNRWIGERH